MNSIDTKNKKEAVLIEQKKIFNKSEQEHNENLGHWMKNLRVSNGLTQEELAELCDVTPKLISKQENGKSCPTVFQFSKTLFHLNSNLGDYYFFESKNMLSLPSYLIQVILKFVSLHPSQEMCEHILEILKELDRSGKE